jgi:hypothetical protein
MKRVILLGFLLASVSPAMAQEETLVAPGGIESGGFGAPVVMFSQVADEFAVFVGGRGGWIVNHTFVLGGGGYGLVNDLGSVSSGIRAIEFGYGGLELEYINNSNKLIHFTIYLLVGGGGLSGSAVSEESVFVLQPAASGELNITRYFRFNFGAGYRWVTAVDSPGWKGSDFSAFYGQVTFKFGSF